MDVGAMHSSYLKDCSSLRMGSSMVEMGHGFLISPIYWWLGCCGYVKLSDVIQGESKIWKMKLNTLSTPGRKGIDTKNAQKLAQLLSTYDGRQPLSHN